MPSLLPKLREIVVSPASNTRNIRQSGYSIHHLSRIASYTQTVCFYVLAPQIVSYSDVMILINELLRGGYIYDSVMVRDYMSRVSRFRITDSERCMFYDCRSAPARPLCQNHPPAPGTQFSPLLAMPAPLHPLPSQFDALARLSFGASNFTSTKSSVETGGEMQCQRYFVTTHFRVKYITTNAKYGLEEYTGHLRLSRNRYNFTQVSAFTLSGFHTFPNVRRLYIWRQYLCAKKSLAYL